jgi:hypothetical protein
MAARPDADRVFADNALAFLQQRGARSVSVARLTRDLSASTQRAAEVAAGCDGRLSLADGAALPRELVEDFFLLRGMAAPGDSVAEARAALEAATRDLLMPSETDARFAFVSGRPLNGAPITPELVRAQLGAQHDALLPTLMDVDPSGVPLAGKTWVEAPSAAEFLDRLVANVDPADPVSVARGRRFAALRTALQAELTDLHVYRFGEISISTFIVGRTRSGALAGLLTGQVET